MKNRLLWVSGLLLVSGSTLAQGPAFKCDKVAADSIEALICQDAELAALDQQLALVYAEASTKAVNEHPATLKAEQRGWVKGRDDCWKSQDQKLCVSESYQQRIVELQARYRLVDSVGPVTWLCDGDSHNQVVVTFFKTKPATLIAERGDSTSLMTQQISASGSRYVGRNESFWEHQGEATIIWGYGAKEMKCKPAQQ